jgi:fermentation-respiration switch protein FrsA (DUF1100 family)
VVRSRIYKPDPMPDRLEWAGLPPPETVSVRADDGMVVQGYRWPALRPGHVTLLFFHGNGGNRYEAAQLAAPLRRDGAEIIVASYRGYGDNSGKPSEHGLRQDATAFLRLARASSPRKLYLFGFSLGGAVALDLAARNKVDGVVTLGTFSSLRSVTPPLARGLLPDQFDNVAAVRRLRAPLLILHGTADTLIPIEEAVKLKAAAGRNARFLRLTGAPHNVALDQLAGRIWREIAAMPDPEAAAAPVSDLGGSAPTP